MEFTEYRSVRVHSFELRSFHSHRTHRLSLKVDQYRISPLIIIPFRPIFSAIDRRPMSPWPLSLPVCAAHSDLHYHLHICLTEHYDSLTLSPIRSTVHSSQGGGHSRIHSPQFRSSLTMHRSTLLCPLHLASFVSTPQYQSQVVVANRTSWLSV